MINDKVNEVIKAWFLSLCVKGNGCYSLLVKLFYACINSESGLLSRWNVLSTPIKVLDLQYLTLLYLIIILKK